MKDRTVADKVIEAGCKKCIRKDVGYIYRSSSFHKLGKKYGVMLKHGGGFTTYEFGDGSKMRLDTIGAEEV